MCAAPVSIPQPNAPTKQVRCYHCRRECQVSTHAMSSSCPHCHRQLAIADVIVRARHWGTNLQTCGRVLVERGADVRVKTLRACGGVEIHGSLRGRVVSLGPVTLGDTATIDGDLEAPAVFVSPGAKIVGGKFCISPVTPTA